jgi:tetraacyldisaccharide-1-P 4'-kinase
VLQYDEAKKVRGGPFDIVILDDSFQHWKIKADVQAVALTSWTASQKFYRDFTGELRHAQFAVWTKGEIRPDTRGLPLVRVRFELPKATGGRHWLITGLGDGVSVRDSLEKEGYAIERHLQFQDHARYEAGLIDEIVKSARASGCRIVLTGKDWVKWRELGVREDEVIHLEPRVVFLEGRDIWDRMLWAPSS